MWIKPSESAQATHTREPYYARLKRKLWLPFSVILAAFCVWQASHFELRPLDAPGTLHPLLLRLMSSLINAHTKSGAGTIRWECWCYLALFTGFALALLNHYAAQGAFSAPGIARRILRSKKLFFLVVAASLILFRAPLLLSGDSNVDESEFIAASMKLFVDPVYFRAVDCHTSGPLNIYVLMLPALVGLSPDYASSRVIALGIILLSLYILYRAFCLMGSEDMARITVLPPLVFFSTVTYPDFVHYGSEQVPILLTALAVYSCAYILQKPQLFKRSLAALGFLTSAAFFSKMQAVPIIVSAACVATAFVYYSRGARRPWSPILCLAGGFLPLPALNLAVCAATGTLRDFWMAYIQANWLYARHSVDFWSQLPTLANFLVYIYEFYLFVLVFIVLLAAALYQDLRKGPRTASAALREVLIMLELLVVGGLVVSAAMGLRESPEKLPSIVASFLFLAVWITLIFVVVIALLRNQQIGWFGVLSAALLGGSMVSIYGSHQYVPHYLILLVIPLSTAVGWLLFRRVAKSDRPVRGLSRIQFKWSPPLSFTILFLGMFAAIAIDAQKRLGYNYGSAAETMGGPEGRLIRSLTHRAGRIVVWGWHPETYLSAGRAPAARDMQMYYFFVANKEIETYYRHRFLSDLEQHPAELFVDATDVSCCYLNDRKTRGFEAAPEISAYIHSHYVEVGRQYGEQFYLRRDLAAQSQ